jgi:hypothetical protein
MRPVKLTIRVAAISVLVVAASGAGCVSKARPGGAALMTGAAGATGAAGDSSGAAGGAGTAPLAGSAGSGAGGANDPTGLAGNAGTMPGTVPSGAGGTVDQGHLFTDAAAVSSAPPDAGATSTPDTGASGDAGPKTVPGDGNTSTCHVGGMNFLLVFTQKGTDVTMVVTANNCPTGSHTIQIHAGFSCDNAGTEGGVWDGKRGDGIPMLSCANNKGTLTYTRSASDPTTSWTVGDHSTKTDVTLHPMSVDTSCGTFF